MLTPRIRVALAALAASAGLAGCTSLGPYGGIGVGVGSGYGGYGYGYDPYYSGYGSAYGYNPYGWYNGYYYPGSGYWVYDPDGHHHPINGDQKAYWSNLREKIREARGAQATTSAVQENWSAFSKHGRVPATVAAASARADQGSLRQLNEARRQARIERQQVQSERQQVQSERAQARAEARQEARQERRARRGTPDE